MDEMVDRLLDILADKLTERLSAGHKELYTAKELAERYGVSCATIRSKMAAGEFGELVSVGERTRLVPWAGVQAYESLSIPAAAVWWLRSPNYNNINNNNYFCAVSSSGSLDYNNANNAYGVVPGFCNAWSHGVAIGERRP